MSAAVLAMLALGDARLFERMSGLLELHADMACAFSLVALVRRFTSG
jgi:hypothetical protein